MDNGALTWDDPLGANLWTRLTWPQMDGLHQGLVLVTAIDARNKVRAVGTGFVVSRIGDIAVCITASHTFYAGIHRVQYPHMLHHPSTPREFIRNFERVDLKGVFAIFRRGEDVVAAPIHAAVWDKHRDLCVFEAEPAEKDRPRFDPLPLLIASTPPSEGQKVAVFGYAGIDHEEDEEQGKGSIASRLEFRVGRIESISKGMLVDGVVATTTIPFYSGISGSPAILFDPPGTTPTVFGFASSDGEPVEDADKENFLISGTGQISILETSVIRLAGNKLLVHLRIGPIAAVIGTMRSGFIPD